MFKRIFHWPLTITTLWWSVMNETIYNKCLNSLLFLTAKFKDKIYCSQFRGFNENGNYYLRILYQIEVFSHNVTWMVKLVVTRVYRMNKGMITETSFIAHCYYTNILSYIARYSGKGCWLLVPVAWFNLFLVILDMIRLAHMVLGSVIKFPFIYILI